MIKFIIKTTAAYVYGQEQLRLRFYVLVRYFVVLDIHLLFISYSPFKYSPVNIYECPSIVNPEFTRRVR